MRKAKWVFEKTQRRRFNLLVRNSVDKLGSKVALEVFGKLGRDTSVKEYNTLIGSCLEKARQSLEEDNFEDQVCYAYRLFTMMREQGFMLEEKTYGPFLLFFADMGMVEEFEYFCKDIKGGNFVSSYRMGYYEMLLWIRVGDEDKVWELWNSIEEVGKEDSYKLAENYLLAFCKADRKEELLQLLEAVDITRISSVENIGYIFMTLGRLILENFVEKFILALKNSDAMEESISSFIYNYVISLPNLTVEEVVSKFKELHERLEVAPSFASYEKLINLCCDCLKKNGYGISIVLKQMKDKDVNLDSETFSYLISTCESEEDIAKCCDQMHQSGIQVTKQVYMALISAYANCGKFDKAKQIYNQISGMDSPDLEVGLKILQHLKELKIRPSRTSLDFLLCACVTARDSQSAQMIFKEYPSAGFPFNVLTYLRSQTHGSYDNNSLSSMYQVLLASGEYESASNMMKKIPKSDPHVRLIIEECQKTYGHGSMPVKEKKKGSIAVQ
ncbi:Pentatricopeptide repeat-containing protein [Acorus calamus]|uniref:Pentatricopeptide repeat-containing protein n=1 Tax=Acorus calamus TaxID=4465 RepID=A0AAV9DT45_ACOCL|nr:Pentatricopeptide repeat-containing protein [Acorus calamus]